MIPSYAYGASCMLSLAMEVYLTLVRLMSSLLALHMF